MKVKVKARHLQEAVGGALVAFERGAAREVAGPEGVRRVRVREEVVRLDAPSVGALAVDGVRVARGRRVERVHAAPVRDLCTRMRMRVRLRVRVRGRGDALLSEPVPPTRTGISD